MTEQSQTVLGEALRLPMAERAEVAVELLASLDGEVDRDAEAAWVEEVERRARRAHEGVSTGADWQTVREHVKQRLERL